MKDSISNIDIQILSNVVMIIKWHISGCSSKSILWAWFWKYLLSVLLLYFLILYCIVLDQYKRNLYSFSKLIGRYWRTLYLATQSSVVWYRVSLLPKEEEGDGNSLFCFCHAIICALLSLFLHSSLWYFIKGYCRLVPLTTVFLYFNLKQKP